MGLEQRSQAEYCSRGHFYSGITMLTRGAPGWSPAKEFVKVKAHQAPDSFPRHSRDWELASGSACADRAANQARERMVLPAAHVFQHHLSVALRGYLEYVSKALLLWPTPTRGRKKRTLQQTQAPAADLRSGMQSGREVLDSRGAAGLSSLGTATPPSHSPAQPPAASSSAGEGIPTTTSAARDSFARPAAASHSHSQSDLGSSSVQREPSVLAASVSSSSHARSESVSRPSAAAPGVSQAPPSLSNAVPPPVPAAPSQPRHRAAATHTWSEARLGGRWICSVCLRTSRLQTPPRERCPGLSRKLQELVSNRQHHSLACCDFPSGILVFCTKCGCQTEGTRLAGLASTCPRAPQSDKTGRNLSRIQSLMHPNPAKFGDQPVLSQPQSRDSLI